MATQKEVAEWLGMSQPAVSQQMADLGIDYRNLAIIEVVAKYQSHLRSVAAQHVSADGEIDLTKERAKKERIEREILEWKLAEIKGQLINVAESEKKFTQMAGAFKSELLARDEKLKTLIFTVYGVDVDITYLNEFTNSALEHLSRYEHSDIEFDAEGGTDSKAIGEVDDNGMGEKTPGNKRKSKRNTGKV